MGYLMPVAPLFRPNTALTLVNVQSWLATFRPETQIYAS